MYNCSFTFSSAILKSESILFSMPLLSTYEIIEYLKPNRFLPEKADFQRLETSKKQKNLFVAKNTQMSGAAGHHKRKS